MGAGMVVHRIFMFADLVVAFWMHWSYRILE